MFPDCNSILQNFVAKVKDLSRMRCEKSNKSRCNINYFNSKCHYRRFNTDMIGDVLVKDLVPSNLWLIIFET